MSFLNPVSEPVLRFSSTDVGAPQINYNARVAGDIKTVLKGCLVTGYGAKASAGWSIVNEVDHVAEFVSPSVAMSDYRLGIDDTSASSTTWYYQYQNARVNPTSNTIVKNISYINKTSSSNGWQLIITDRGVYLVEVFYSNAVSGTMSRVTYWGAVKSALTNESGRNIGFWSIGNAASITPPAFFSSSGSPIYSFDVGGLNGIRMMASNQQIISSVNKAYDITSVDLISNIYLYSNPSLLVGQQLGLLIKDTNTLADLYGEKDVTINGRPMLKVCLGVDSSSGTDRPNNHCRVVLICLDYWEC